MIMGHQHSKIGDCSEPARRCFRPHDVYGHTRLSKNVHVQALLVSFPVFPVFIASPQSHTTVKTPATNEFQLSQTNIHCKQFDQAVSVLMVPSRALDGVPSVVVGLGRSLPADSPSGATPPPGTICNLPWKTKPTPGRNSLNSS